MTDTGGTFYYHGDPLGSITDLTDASGAAQWRYEYEGYGAERSATNVSGTAPVNRLRFDAQYLDPETGEYHLRARQYDPATGRFDGIDPIDNSPGTPFDAAYMYVDGRPTVLDDPSGLDPRLGNANLDCARNAFLCLLIYNTGYSDGCKGACVQKTLTTLQDRGIELSAIVAAAQGKAKVVAASDGPDGPGIYLVGQGKPRLLKPPADPTCGFICSIGLAATKMLGCQSEASCVKEAAMTFFPMGRACRVGRRALNVTRHAYERLRRLDRLSRAGQAVGRVRNFNVPNPGAAANRVVRSLTKGPGVVVQHPRPGVTVYKLPEGGEVVLRSPAGSSWGLWAVDVHNVPGVGTIKTHFR
jgi:RHS repeat-associated protein